MMLMESNSKEEIDKNGNNDKTILSYIFDTFISQLRFKKFPLCCVI